MNVALIVMETLCMFCLLSSSRARSTLLRASARSVYHHHLYLLREMDFSLPLFDAIDDEIEEASRGV